MNIIKRWLKSRREEREALEALELQKIENDVRDAENKCNSFEYSMFSLDCPFTKHKCNSGCVHFTSGTTYKLPQVYGGVYVGYNLPRCLLWNK